MRSLRGLMRYRAFCPFCGAHFTRHEYMHSGLRRCAACHALLVPAEPANRIGNIVFGVGTAFLTVIGGFVGLQFGNSTVSALVAGVAMGFAGLCVGIVLGGIAFPYITPFAAATPRCRWCGYDLRASRWRCPECGRSPGEVRTATIREPWT